ARLVRTEVLRVRSDAYVDAARLAGLSELRLTLRHVLPNSCRPGCRRILVRAAQRSPRSARCPCSGWGCRGPRRARRPGGSPAGRRVHPGVRWC
ncbi:hypothetical protein AB1460_26265, partial [Parafrankia sp. FMc2]